MEKSTNIKVFDNYLSKTQRKVKALPSYEDFFRLHLPAHNNLILHLQNAPLEYKYFIETICKYLFQPNMFYTIQNKLIGLKNSTIIFSGSADLFGYFGLPPFNVFDPCVNLNDAYFQKLYNLYYVYLKSYENTPSPYNRYIANVYKTVASNPRLYGAFLNTTPPFCFINKELCIIYSYKKYRFDVLNILQESCTSSPKKLVPLLNTLPKILDGTSFHTSAPCCRSNYSFNFSAQGNIFHAYFCDEGIKFEKNRNEYVQIMRPLNLDQFTQINCPQGWIDILYAITGGIKQNMDNFSILCALIMTNYYKNISYTLPSKNCSPLSPYAVYALEEQADAIRYWLEYIILDGYTQPIYQLKDITKTTNKLNLIMQNLIVPTYIPVKPSKTKETESQMKTVKEIIKRKEIKVKDGNGLNHTLINHLPVICFVDDPNQLRRLQNNFRPKTFTFKPSSILNLKNFEIQNYEVLPYILSIYGLKLLYDSNFKHDSSIKWHKQSENITENFINDCLKPEDGNIIYADSLYNIYTNYYNLLYGGSPLTRICFIKELRKLLSDRSWSCQYKKPRTSRSDNRYAFIGIKIDIEKASEAAKRAEELHENTSKTAFANYLLDMQDCVNKILRSLHHDLYEIKALSREVCKFF